MFSGFGLPHLIILLAVVLLLFGAGRLPNVMGDFAKGIKAFKAGLKDEDEKPQEPTKQIPEAAAPPPAPGETVGNDRKVG